MKNNIHANLGVTLIHAIIALALLGLLVGGFYAIFGSSGSKEAQIASCKVTTQKIVDMKKMKEASNEHEAGKLCKEINKLIDKYNKDGCGELIGTGDMEKEDCK